MPFRSPFEDVEIPNLSVFDYLFADLEPEAATKTALVDGTSGEATSYGALVVQIQRVAGALAARGIRTGDVVALHSPNVPAFATAFHGILRAGATATTVNALYTAEEIEKQLRDSAAIMLITVSPLLPQAAAAAKAAGIERVIVMDGAEGHESLRDLIMEDAPAPDVSFDPATHIAVLPYSSGTTGLPKGVVLTHRNLVANVAQSLAQITLNDEDRVMAVLPFFHIYGMTVLLNLALRVRAALVTMPRFDLPEFLRIIQDHKISWVFIAPPIAVALAKHPIVDNYDLSSIKVVFSGAAPLDGDLAKAVASRLHCVVRQGYGMSEMSPVSHAIPVERDDIPLDTVGLTLPNMECKIVDPETGAEIEVPSEGVSAPGELWCKGPNIMVGYLHNDAATAEVLDAEGWLRTGDIATVTAEGYVRVVDRLKELIKYKGYQVAPAELEALLLTNPLIADAAVLGVHDADGEEVPKAFIVKQANAELSELDVMEFVAEHVAPYKKVRVVEFIDMIPKSSAGKILRKDLRAAVG
ncbi:MAG TPA: AMP-binding protein [Microbacteriaceae bacterium]|nr:AMP-binding protein [Microbacteriaceae bacterium]HQZ47488.1 AMP-binding protein [Microbacteriaceae bacterium]